MRKAGWVKLHEPDVFVALNLGAYMTHSAQCAVLIAALHRKRLIAPYELRLLSPYVG